MLRIRFAIAVALLAIGASQGGAAPNVWTKVGPEGAAVTVVAIDPDTPSTMYAATEGGVAKSVDGGVTWVDASSGITKLTIRDLAIDPLSPSTIWAAAASHLFVSTDGAASWNVVASAVSGAGALAVDPITSGIVYRGIGTTVARSTDSGATWTSTQILPDGQVTDLEIDPLTPSTIYAAVFQGGVRKTTNSGATWINASGGLGNTDVESLAIDPQNPAILYAGTRAGLYKSSDGGAIWVTSLAGQWVEAVAVDPVTPATVYIRLLTGEIRKSINGGTTWTPVPGVGGGRGITIDPVTPATLYAGTWPGVAKSIDAGASWATSSAGLHYVPITRLATDPTDPAIIYAVGYPSGVLKSVDAGASWASAGSGLSPLLVPGDIVLDATNPSTLYLADLNGIYRTTNGAGSWSLMPSPGSPPLTVLIDPSDSMTLYAGTYSGVSKSIDGGGSWSNASIAAGVIRAVAVDSLNPGVVYAASQGGGIFRSADGGATWAARNTGLPSLSMADLAIDPLVPTVLYTAASTRVSKTVNGATSWAAAITGLPSEFMQRLRVDPVRHKVVYVGVSNFNTGGVFASSNSAATWSALGTGLQGQSVTDIVVASPSRLYAGTTAGGVFRIDLDLCQTTAACDDANLCTTDSCDPGNAEAGLDGCVHALAPCAPAGQCQQAGVCNPGTGLCTFAPRPNGTPCTDGELCTADACQAGACVSGPYPACRQAEEARLSLVRYDATTARVTSAMRGGLTDDVAELGNPFDDTAYTLCVLDRSGPSGAVGLVLRAGVPAGSGWRPIGTPTPRGLKYTRRDGSPDGVQTVKMQAGTDHRARIQIKGTGANLGLVAPPLQLPVTVQLLRSDTTSVCWQSSYTEAQTNVPGRFTATSAD